MENNNTTDIHSFMANNCKRCLELTDMLFSMKYELYKSMYPDYDDYKIWEAIINDIIKRKNASWKKYL